MISVTGTAELVKGLSVDRLPSAQLTVLSLCDQVVSNVLNESNIHVEKELSQEVIVIERALCLYQTNFC